MYEARLKAALADRFDVSEIVYVNAKTKVRLTCKEGHNFEQRPDHLLRGVGCPKCGGTSKKSVEALAEEFRAVHGGRYTYDFSTYKNSVSKLKMLCAEGHEFHQDASHHLRGHGCPKCAGVVKISFTEFKAMADEVHGEAYKYREETFTNMSSKMSIICGCGNEFLRAPKEHLTTIRCPKCAGDVAGSKESFLAEVAKRFPNRKYDYSRVKYVNSKTQVVIICDKGHEFHQSPSNHLAGKECNICAGNRRSTTERFVATAREVHGSEYDYKDAVYLSRHSKLQIVCSKGHTFWQSAANHLRGQGCANCAVTGYKPSIDGYLYLIRIGEGILGYGITNDFPQRYRAHRRNFRLSGTKYALLGVFGGVGYDVVQVENTIKKSFAAIPTTIEGFVTEAVSIDNLQDVLAIVLATLDTAPQQCYKHPNN